LEVAQRLAGCGKFGRYKVVACRRLWMYDEPFGSIARLVTEDVGTTTGDLCSAKIQLRHRIDHFGEPTSPGLSPDIAGVPRAVATLLVRAAVLKPPHRQSSPLPYRSCRDGQELCAPVQICKKDKKEGHSRMSRFGSGVGSDSTDQ
jgi:hypothetical protein